jgi:hypothetical protein
VGFINYHLYELPLDIKLGEALSLFLNEKVISLLVTETNRCTDQKLLQHPSNEHARMKRWKPTTTEEIKTLLI